MRFGPRVPQKKIKRGEKVSAVVLCTTARLLVSLDVEINPRFYRGKKSERSDNRKGEANAKPKDFKKRRTSSIIVVVWRPHY